MSPEPDNSKAYCGSPEHSVHRRLFLEGGFAASALSAASFSGLFSVPAFAEQMNSKAKRCILLWLCGAPSQFETWDPKPGKRTSGPFGSIPSCLPGVHVSELMPQCSQILDKLAIIRSMSTKPSEHFQGIDALTRGHEPRPPFQRPILGSVLAQQLGAARFPGSTIRVARSLPRRQ
ncbi:MAG: DUF1501 domain-containing protein [Planctomycetota bacterium]